jgi:hypothetical protein
MMLVGVGQSGEPGDVFFTEPLQQREAGTEMFEGREVEVGPGTGWSAPTLTPYEQEAQALELRRLQEDTAGLQAYVMVAAELGVDPNSPELVAEGLAQKGLTSEEVADWIVACNYELPCFSETMHYEFYEAAERRKTLKAGGYLVLGGVVVGVLVLLAWRKGG